MAFLFVTAGAAPLVAAGAVPPATGAGQRHAARLGQFRAGRHGRGRARTSFGVVELEPDRNAQYQADIEIDGDVDFHAMVDTGATFVALTAEDARQLDLDPPASSVSMATDAQTAQRDRLGRPRPTCAGIRVNDITVYDVDAIVAPPGAASITLLGMELSEETFREFPGRLRTLRDEAVKQKRRPEGRLSLFVQEKLTSC